jgi:hypothetical protein
VCRDADGLLLGWRELVDALRTNGTDEEKTGETNDAEGF